MVIQKDNAAHVSFPRITAKLPNVVRGNGVRRSQFRRFCDIIDVRQNRQEYRV